MDDLIRRSDVKDKLKECLKKASPPLMYPDWNDAVLAVMTSPAVDAVEVCRCKDCRYGTIDQYSAGEYVVVCDVPKKRPGTDVYALDWFCPMGQRREEEHNAKAD